MTPRTWAEIETEKLGRKYQYFSEPAITLAFLQEHRRAVRIVKAEIKRVKKDQHVFTAQTKGYLLEMLNSVLAALKRGRATRRK